MNSQAESSSAQSSQQASVNSRLLGHIDPASSEDVEFVTVLLGDQMFGINIQSVREIRGKTAMTPLPHSPAHVLGVINLRGAVIPVVDLRKRLRLPAAPDLERTVIVVVQGEKRLYGLLVDEMSDILAIAAENIQAVPTVSDSDLTAFVDGMSTIEERIIQFLQLDKIFGGTVADAA